MAQGRKWKIMRPEVVAATETFKFIKVNPRKRIKRAAGLYLLSSQGRELGHAVRSGYLFMRHIDDVIDGDRHLTSDPLAYVLDLRKQIETNQFKFDTKISALAKGALEYLETVKKPADNPRQDF